MTAPAGAERRDDGGRWAALLEALLRGIGHALSNRVAALLALAEIPAQEHDAESLGLLPHEAERLQELLLLVKLLPAEHGADAGALLLDEVIEEACALMRLHPSGREIAWRRSVAGDSPPVRVERWVLLRVLLLMMDAGREHASAVGSRVVELRVAEAEQGRSAELRVAVDGGAEPGAMAACAPDPYLAALVERMGGSLAGAEPFTLRLPTLAELRRRGR